MHIARTALVCLAFLLSGSIVELGESPQRQAILTSAHLLIPTSANYTGQFGAVFKTRVSIVNVTNRTYTINATLYRSPTGTIIRQITMGPGQARNYNNFLQDVFSYSGAAGIDLDASVAVPGGSDLNKFALFAEVYNDGAKGVYKTVVNIADPSDGLSLTDPSITPGIFVDGSARTNVGCVNTATTQAIVNVDVYASSGGLLTTHFLTVPANGWAQNGVLHDVSGGYLIWRLQSGVSPSCFAIVVDNQTNDGSFITPSKVVN